MRMLFIAGLVLTVLGGTGLLLCSYILFNCGHFALASLVVLSFGVSFVINGFLGMKGYGGWM